MRADIPKNVTQLKLFLGKLNYYDIYLLNLADIVEPHHKLLKKALDKTGGMSKEMHLKKLSIFCVLKKLLWHCDHKKPLVLACNVSSCGLGAALSHVLTDEVKRLWLTCLTL